ncbi:MAG TPA: cardiolipin synthase, partial [Candidatus Avibacteroides excrementipullorum]|nr:cardiolipin synthase [Candidatus Avibacteroides excrementipullorum]
DKKTTLMLKEMFHKDMRHSRRILLKNWNKRPIYHKTKESFIRIFSPLL